MSDIDKAAAYRIAADYLDGENDGWGPANLRAEADRLDGIVKRNHDIGNKLLRVQANYQSGIDPAELGRKAWELVNADRKLHTPPSTESLTARDDIE